MHVSQEQERSRKQRRSRLEQRENALQYYLYQLALHRAGRRRRWLLDYLSVLPMLAIATLLTFLLQHVVNNFVVPAGALVLVIATTALLWGWGPALLLFFLGMLILEYFVFEPYGRDVFSWPNVLQVLPFAFAVLVINILSFQRDRGWVKARLSATEHQHAREELSVLIEMIPQLVWIARPDGFVEDGNQHISTYLGVPLERFNGDQWFDFIHPDDQQKTWEVWQTALRTGHPHEVEHRFLEGSTHTFRWFLTRAMPVRDDAGQIVKWFGTCTDIDDQKRIEQALRQSREELSVLMETIPQLVWIARPDGFVEDGNQHLFTYLGVPLERFNGQQWLDGIHPDDREKTWESWQTALRTGQWHEVENRVREGKTGNYRWFLNRAMPYKDAQGTILKWFGTSTDIDDQKRIEQALRQSQERIRALFDSSLIGMSCVEVEGEVLVEANEAFLQMCGYSREDVDRRMLIRARITAPEDEPLFKHALQELTVRGQHTPFETELVRKDGSRLPVLVGGILFQGHPRQIVAFVLDNSARKELEQRKDDFISMASHELRNPLTALKLQTSRLYRQLIGQGIPAPALSGMEVQINTITRLVEELLDVSKIQTGGLEYRQEMVDFDAKLREIADTMQQTHPSHRIQVVGSVQVALVADRDRLGQIFTNLLSNAIKYSPDAETVEMNMSATEDAVTIRVRDHGLGIPQEQREKIFERFYRATGPKQRAIPGLGMGLYIVAEIIKHYGGTIKVESTVGQGSTFTVTLPQMRNG
jgi:PAS domain S-box-containing protein